MSTIISRPTLTDDTGDLLSGTPFDAAFWTDIFDRIDAMFSGQIACRLFHSAAQTGTNAADVTVTFDSEDFDVGGCHEAVTHPERLTVPAGKSGLYLIRAQVQWASANNGMRRVQIRKNGADIIAESRVQAAAAAAICTLQCGIEDQAAAAAYYEIRCQQASGGDININGATGVTLFAMTRLS